MKGGLSMSQNMDDKFIQNAVEQYSGMITRIAFLHIRNRMDAEDIMQDVFFALLKQPPFETEEHLKAWLIRVTINKSNDYFRAAKHRHTDKLNSEYALSVEQKEVFDELQKLSEKDRNILYLFYYEEYSAKEIADILNKKESAIFMRLTRARKKLKNILEVEE